METLRWQLDTWVGPESVGAGTEGLLGGQEGLSLETGPHLWGVRSGEKARGGWRSLELLAAPASPGVKGEPEGVRPGGQPGVSSLRTKTSMLGI